MCNSKKGLVLLGHISSPHGIKGEVVIKTYTSDPVNIGIYGRLSDEQGNEKFTLENLRVVRKGVIASIDGVTCRNAAEVLRGVKLYVAREKLPTLENDEFYHTDIVGLKVRCLEGTELGVIVSVQNFGAGDLIELRLNKSQQTEFIPLTKDFVIKLDFKTKDVVVDYADSTFLKCESRRKHCT
ncbi:MAG: Ribosome maturation factor RimM [Hyphomicrobiaceae bacterium hypho_1]